jgi:deoxycytidylate deaminase
MKRIAKKLALKVTKSKFKHACLILDHGCLVAQANNEKGHAEQVALDIHIDKDNTVRYRGRLDICEYEGNTLISMRVKKDGSFGNSKPCDRCEIAIKLAKIRKVIYFEQGNWKEEYR